MRLLLALIAYALLAVPAANAQTSTQSFRQEMLERLVQVMPGTTLSPKAGDPLAISFNSAELGDGQINLDRIYAYCRRASAEDCEREKQQFIEGITSRPPPPTPASLRLIVRDEQYVNGMNQMAAQSTAAKPDRMVFEPLGGGLFAILVSDSPTALMMISELTLADINLTREQGWAFARRQTRVLLPTMPTADQLRTGPVLFEDHEFGGSLLIDLPAWAKLAREAGPDLIVTVVSDRIVFVALMPDGPRLESFRTSVQADCAAQARCISPNIYRFRNGGWVVAE